MPNIFANLPCTPDPDAVPPQIELVEDRTDDPQQTLVYLAHEFLQHDRIALAALSAEDRRAQVKARAELAKHVVTYWEQAKANGWNPIERDEWSTVAGMNDLAQQLLINAQESMSDTDEIDQA